MSGEIHKGIPAAIYNGILRTTSRAIPARIT